MTAQLFAIFAFGAVITGVVFLGIVRAREFDEKAKKVRVETKRDADR